MKIEKAVRKKVPMLISVAGQSGSGKTFSSLLMASGLGERVGFLDTENGRGSMYADSPSIKAALPQGYEIAELREPFTPARYSEAVDAFESHGCDVMVIDSMTHEWEGHGGCFDIAMNNKLGGLPNWVKAKMEHKRMMNRLLASSMHIIFCLRAQEKTKVDKNEKGKETFIPIGIQPIQEKNFVFEMTLSLLLEENTHKPIVTKCPEPLLGLFSGEQSLITKQTGVKLREWAEAASLAKEEDGALFEQALAYANEGMTALKGFWDGLSNKQKKDLQPKWEEVKSVAGMADDRKQEKKSALSEPEA
jgi:hypothetical protein